MSDNHPQLAAAVERLAQAMQGLPDEALGRPYAWRDHDMEGLRYALLGSYHELRELAVAIGGARAATGRPPTQAQLILGGYQAAYRDLRAVLLGVTPEELDQPPAEKEWPVREALRHMLDAERLFFTLVHVGVEQYRAGRPPVEPQLEQIEALLGPRRAFKQLVRTADAAAILDYHAGLNDRIRTDLALLADDDLQAPTPFWEPSVPTAAYRLHRLDVHLRQHTVQVEKTLAALGRRPTEARRLLRLVYHGLAEVEGALLGAEDVMLPERAETAARIAARAEEIE
jgi:hypothetical protein